MRAARIVLLTVALALTASTTTTSGCGHALLRDPVGSLPHPPSVARAFSELRGRGGETAVVLLPDNAAAWAARWELLARAHETIDASYFIVEDDLFGMAFVGALLRRAEERVHVRLLVDARGSLAFTVPLLGRDALQELAATRNAEVRVFSPPVNQLLRTLIEGSAVPVSAGTHGKILVVDGAAAITGGRNIGEAYAERYSENPRAVADLDVMLEGKDTAAALTRLVDREMGPTTSDEVAPDVVNFSPQREQLLIVAGAMDAWLRGAVAPGADAALRLEAAGIATLHALPARDARDAARPYLQRLAALSSLRGLLAAPAGPGTGGGAGAARFAADVRVVGARSRVQGVDDAANDAVLRAIGAATRRVWIQSPYFLASPRLISALRSASARGVEIVVVTNGPTSSDDDMAQALFIDSWPEIEARVPRLRVFVSATGQMLHTKRIVVDDELTLVGSHNLDPLSSHLNSEIVVGVWSPAFNAANADAVSSLLVAGDVYEYRIARGADGRALRHDDGAVIVAFGPKNHVPKKRLADLESLKTFLFSVRNIWDFEWSAW